MSKESKREPTLASGMAEALGLAAELVVTTFVGVGLGWLISRWVGGTVVLILVGALAGGAAGINQVYRRWKKKT